VADLDDEALDQVVKDLLNSLARLHELSQRLAADNPLMEHERSIYARHQTRFRDLASRRGSISKMLREATERAESMTEPKNDNDVLENISILVVQHALAGVENPFLELKGALP
jgi:phosphomevalonate kinase